MVAGPTGNLVSALVAPFPPWWSANYSACRPGDLPAFHWHLAISSIHAHDSAGVTAALEDMRSYLLRQLAAKRATPGDGLLSQWTADSGQVLTDEELTELGAVVLLAGLEVDAVATRGCGRCSPTRRSSPSCSRRASCAPRPRR